MILITMIIQPQQLLKAYLNWMKKILMILTSKRRKNLIGLRNGLMKMVL